MAHTQERRVVIVGGGVAGLSAAHELGERGFSVQVFEQRDVPGGKARSTRVPNTAVAPRQPLPGEHGFRFFPGFYWHLPDTMQRIPTPDGKTVADHLRAVATITFAFDQAPNYSLPAHRPKTWGELQLVLRYIAALGDMGISSDDLVFIAWQLWKIITSCDARRIEGVETLSWWEYVDAANRSEAFRRLLVVGVTRNLVASRAEKANARTVGQVGIQLLLDLFTGARSTDRILDGPTNDVWIDPWVEHLKSGLKVEYELGWELDHLELDREQQRVVRVVLREAKARAPEPSVAPAEPMRDASEPATDQAKRTAREERRALFRERARARRAEQAHQAKELRAPADVPPKTRAIEGDHFVFALPVEVMAEVLAKQPELLALDPGLGGILELGRHQVEWMNGIQFYLTADVPIASGHINHVDSAWALTSISQSQFWPDFPSSGYADGSVRTILSVDISAWDIPGAGGKEARDCDYQEVAEETWRQLKQSLNRESAVLADEMLHPTTPWHIDDDIVERVRKEKRLRRGQRARRAEQKRSQGREGEPDLLTNAEPLLVNLANSWQLRPNVTTALGNLYLASDYLRTHTNLATMEAANEAARAATNAILDATHSSEARCHIQPLVEPFAGLRARDAERIARREHHKNPVLVDAFAFLTLFVGVSGIKALAWLNAVPRLLWLLTLGLIGGLYAFGRVWDDAWLLAFRGACELAWHAGPPPVACLAAMPPVPSSAARAEFWYAGYLALFGLSLFTMPKKTLGQLGFPDEYGAWIPIMAVTPLIMSVFYATSAVFDVRLFFWFTVVGRITVFLSVLYLTEGRNRGSPLLILVAAPDVLSAVWSGMTLAPTPALGRFFLVGVVNLTAAFAFSVFPVGTLRALGFPGKVSAWVPMAAILLWFWGVYSALSVAFALTPMLLAGVVAEGVMALFCAFAPLLYGARQEAAGPGLRLSLVGVGYAALTWWLWAGMAG